MLASPSAWRATLPVFRLEHNLPAQGAGGIDARAAPKPADLEHDPKKWKPVLRRSCDKTKDSEALSDQSDRITL